MLTVAAFLLALAILIAVHEYGHYRMARACGVRVLRFSIGFGKVLWRRQPRPDATEFTLCVVPLGGYVRMLDEREAPVAPEERHQAFNTQPLRARALIVLAGPLANLLLAVALYAVVGWVGSEQPRAVLASPPADSVAARAGVLGGERVAQAAPDDEALQDVRSFDELRWLLTRAALDGSDVRLLLAGGRELVLPLAELQAREADAELLRRIGIAVPFTRAQIGAMTDAGAARRAGLRTGDLVLQTDGQPVRDGQELRARIRAAARDGQPGLMHWRIARDGVVREIEVEPEAVREGERWIGRIGAYVGAAPEMVLVRLGPWEGLAQAGARVWETAALSLRMMGRMVIGEASVKNLSGPLAIADYAGKSARLGLLQYLTFLALISVSLGVLNLLPLPLLDGGHLMYYLWEAVTGRPVSEVWVERLQRVGMALLFWVMGIALFNDVMRLLG